MESDIFVTPENENEGIFQKFSLIIPLNKLQNCLVLSLNHIKEGNA